METNRTAHARPTGRNQTGQNQLAAKFIKGVASQAVSQSIRCERRVNITQNEPKRRRIDKIWYRILKYRLEMTDMTERNMLKVMNCEQVIQKCPKN